MVRVETRSLTADEERQLVGEAAATESRGEAGCLLALGLLGAPTIGFLIGDNFAEWLGLAHDSAVRGGAAVGLVAGALWAAAPLVLARRAGPLLGAERRLRLAACPVERWTFEPARAFGVDCRQARALLFELTDGRLVLLAARQLEGLPADRYPPRVEMEVLPQLDRVLSLQVSGEPRPTADARFTLEELGNDYPLKKRRFAEIAAEGLDDPTRARLGLPPGSGAELPRPSESSGLPLDRSFAASGGDLGWLRPLATGPARLAAWILAFIVPALVLAAIVTARMTGARLPRDGAAASALLILLVLWVLAAVLGELVRYRSVLGVLRRGHGRRVHARGRVRATRTFPAPLTGRPVVAARVDLLLGPHGLMQGVDFELLAEDGAPLRVDVREARLLMDCGDRRVVRVETAEAERLAGRVDADWARKRRYQFPTEGVIGDGDLVDVLGQRDGTGAITGTPDRPLLLWTGDDPRGATAPVWW